MLTQVKHKPGAEKSRNMLEAVQMVAVRVAKIII